MKELVALEERVLAHRGGLPPDDLLVRAKKDGFADPRPPPVQGATRA